MTHQFKAGDKGKTRGGNDYEVLVIDAKGKYPIVANINYGDRWEVETHRSDGKYTIGATSAEDLLPPKAQATVWVPLLCDCHGEVFGGKAYSRRENALRDPILKVIAVKKVTITEGEWDE